MSRSSKYIWMYSPMWWWWTRRFSSLTSNWIRVSFRFMWETERIRCVFYGFLFFFFLFVRYADESEHAIRERVPIRIGDQRRFIGGVLTVVQTANVHYGAYFGIDFPLCEHFLCVVGMKYRICQLAPIFHQWNYEEHAGQKFCWLKYYFVFVLWPFCYSFIHSFRRWYFGDQRSMHFATVSV